MLPLALVGKNPAAQQGQATRKSRHRHKGRCRGRRQEAGSTGHGHEKVGRLDFGSVLQGGTGAIGGKIAFKVVFLDFWFVGQGGEPDCHTRAAAVGVVQEGAGGGIVEDIVVVIQGGTGAIGDKNPPALE